MGRVRLGDTAVLQVSRSACSMLTWYIPQSSVQYHSRVILLPYDASQHARIPLLSQHLVLQPRSEFRGQLSILNVDYKYTFTTSGT